MTGFTVPVAVTERTIGPSVTLAVTIFGAVVLPVRKYQPARTATKAIASIQALFFESFMCGAQLSSGDSSVSSNHRLIDVPCHPGFAAGKRKCYRRGRVRGQREGAL